jgi:hypothetical protein
MPNADSSLSSSSAQVPLLLPAELRDTVLNGAAEIVVEHAARRRCFLHIHSEEERVAVIESLTDPADTGRRAHEKWLKELRWARAVLWGDHRTRRFVRYADHRVWPAHAHVSRVVAVVRQLILCDEKDGAAALKKANDMSRAAQILEREATQPGLHLLTDSTLPGSGVLYQVAQTRKRERDAAAPSMPSVLTRVDDAVVEKTAWVAEVKQVSYAVSGVLQLQFGAASLRQLVELLHRPQLSSGASTDSSSLNVRQQWKLLVEQHRMWAEYQSLFADVAEACRMWGASEAAVARDVHAAIEGGRSVHLRTGVRMSVLHRTTLLLLVSTRPRKLEGVTATEQHAVEAAVLMRSWAQCLDDGLVRMMQYPASGELTLNSLESTIRQIFVSPALSASPLEECCTMSAPVTISEDLRLMTLSSRFNPYVVVHGSRVDGGFAGDAAYYQSLQRERDRLVEERTHEQVRQGYLGAPPQTSSFATSGGGGTRGNAASTSSAFSAVVKQPLASSPTSDATGYLFKRSLVSVLTVAPLSKAEIQQHPIMQQFKGESNFDALLNAKLKEVAEFKGRKYQLRS